MKRHTLIHAGIAKDNEHLYNVTIGTDMGQFSGSVECRPEDYNHESRFFGFELAELKAEIEYTRAKKKFYDAQIAALTRFWEEMKGTRTYDLDAFWVKKMRERLKDLEADRNFWANRAWYLRDRYRTKIIAFDTMYKHRKTGE